MIGIIFDDITHPHLSDKQPDQIKEVHISKLSTNVSRYIHLHSDKEGKIELFYNFLFYYKYKGGFFNTTIS